MKAREWPTEIEAIDIQVRRLLERRSQLLHRASAPDDPRPARTANTHAGLRARAAASPDASLPHPEAHVALGDLP